MVTACTVSSYDADGGSELDGAVDAESDPEDAGAPSMMDPCTAEGMGATLGESCTSAEACNDGCFCNGVEQCDDGVCVAGSDPCTDTVDCTEDGCIEANDRCVFEPQHDRCADDDACNGVEVCHRVNGCGPGVPLYCNDDDSCTVDSCDPGVGCVFVPRDLDGDGYPNGRCGGEDCDDDPRSGRDIHPGATEDCENRRDDDCDGMRDYFDGDCVPVNDTCDTATTLPGPGTYSGSTRTLANHYTLSCGPTFAVADAVFRFSLLETSDVTVTLAGGGTGAAVTIREMSGCVSGPDLRCNSGMPPTALAHSLPAGDYAIIVQTLGSVAFELDLRITDPTPPTPGDTCATAVDITTAGASVPASALLRDTPPSCTSTFGTYNDAYFYFDLDTTSDVTVTTHSAGAWHYVSVSTACGDVRSQLRCQGGSNEQALTWRSLPAGRYFVTVASSPLSGDITASVDMRPPTPIPAYDRCDGAVMLTQGTARSDTMVGLDDDALGCAGTGYLDAFYEFTLNRRMRAVINVADDDGSGSFFFLTLLESCDSATSLTCSSGNTPSINQILDPGTYVLMVETFASDPSDYFITSSFFRP